MVKIIPAILAHQEKDFEEALIKIDGHFSQVQIDICAQDFVGTETMSIDMMVFPLTWHLSWHLMVNSFEKWEQVLVLQTDNIIVHAESQLAEKKIIRDNKIKWGLAINPETDINQVARLADQYDFIQLMGVIPGAQGQEFHPAITEKIILLKDRGIAKPIWIDGGINPQSVKYLRNLDIDTLVVGSYLLESSNILSKKEEIEKSFYQV